MNELYEELKRYSEVDVDVPLSKMTTLRIGGKAKYTVYPENQVALDSIIRVLKKRGVTYKLIGKGSDLLCSDEDFDGVIIRLDRHCHNSYFDENRLTVQAGCSIIMLAVEAMKKGLSGLEFASGIPGTVGGAIFMNAGAYKSSMSDILDEVLVLRDNTSEWIKAEDCEFSYRSSIFQKHPDWIILGARMTLTPKDSKEISDLMEDRRKRRMASQPLEYPTCGSVFRNPEGMNAWQLIDGIDYRGKRIGDAMVSDKHCNFICNMGNAKAEDYLTLVKEIQEAVYEKYGVMLHTEMEMFNWRETE
ncbi:MAG: UDP-N-acetylmuramate dehydrogenase [Erysipelotrichaceae bacterium]|nr:UDP-N-acetylmuramate dehydrogenase [Erysipelotrichaceae bacterium]